MECGLAGKALVILQEALQRRGISSTELIDLSLRVVEHSFIELGSEDGDFHIKQLLSGIEESIIEDIINLQSYFDKAKWVFMTNEEYYFRYQRQIFDCLKSAEKQGRIEYALSLLIQILEHHTTLDLLFQVSSCKENLTNLQRDQDIAQIAFDFLITSEAISYKNSASLSSIIGKLQEMTLSTNQGLLLKKILGPQLHLQEEILSKYRTEVSLKSLLQIQISHPTQTKNEFMQLVQQILESQIKKSKNVKDKVIALSKLAMSSANQDDEGSSKWIQLLQDLLHLKDVLCPKSDIDVYTLFMKSILQGRVIKSIEDLINSGMIPIDELQTNILKQLQDQFNSTTREDFYKTAQTNKQFLELLLKHDPKKVYHSRIKEELKLIEVCFYLIQHEILVNEINWAQLRADFQQQRLIDRILQVHGFEHFPDSLNTLTQIQQILNQSNLNLVISKVLKHLNQIRLFDAPQNFPDFIEDMINRLFLQREADFGWINQDHTVEVLFKIGEKSTNRLFQKAIMKFLVKECDKQKDLFYQVSLQLIQNSKLYQRLELNESLLSALDENIPSKVKYLISRHYKKRDKEVQQYIEIVSSGEFSHKQRKLLANILSLDQEQLQKIKILKKEAHEEFIKLFTSQQAYEEYTGKLNVEKRRIHVAPKIIEPEIAQDKSFESCEATPLQQLLKAEAVIDAQMVLDMEYSEWNGTIKFAQIIADMEIEGVKELNQNVTEAVHEKAVEINPKLTPQLLTNIKESQYDLPVNYLAIVDDLLQDKEEYWESIMSDGQSVLIAQIRKIVTDTNYLSIAIKLEEYNSQYSSLVAACLYANKLEAVIKSKNSIVKMRNIDRILYGNVSKDSLEEMIEDDRIVTQLNQRFKQLIGDNIDEQMLKQILIE